MSGYRLKSAGDTALIVEFGERIDRDINDRVLTLARELQAAKLEGVNEIAPTFRSLAIYYDPLRCSIGQLSQAIEKLLARPKTGAPAGRLWRLPVCYDASLAPDLDEVAAATSPLGPTGDRAAQRRDLSRLHARLPAGPGLSRRPAAHSFRCRAGRRRERKSRPARSPSP